MEDKQPIYQDLQEKEMSLFFDQCFDQGLFQEFNPEEYKRTLYLLEKIGIRENWRILEPGCGCGRLTRLIAEKVGPQGFIEACELSPKMVDYCRKSRFPNWVRFSNRSVLNLELPKASIDAIICFNVWPHFLKPEVYLSRFCRYLKPDGILYICHSCGRETVNSIHHKTAAEIICSHFLNSTDEMERFLYENRWKTIEKIDTEELYFLRAVYREF